MAVKVPGSAGLSFTKRPSAALPSGVITVPSFSVVSGPVAPHTLISSTPAQVAVWANQGAGANQWDDQSGNARHFTEATNPPTLNPTSINGHPAYEGDGVNDIFRGVAFVLAQPVWIWMVVRQDTWTLGDRITGFSSGATGPAIVTNGSSPTVAIFAGSTVGANANLTVGDAKFVMALFNGASSYLEIGATRTTGNAGANGITSAMAVFGGTTQFCDMSLAAYGIYGAEPTAGEITALKTWAADYYGAGVLT
jgi:hypothetical protein